MNVFLATLAAIIAPEALARNRAQEAKFNAAAQPFDAAAEFLYAKSRSWNADVCRVMAEALSLLDPKYNGLKASFEQKVANSNGVVYENLSVLTSLRNVNHQIIPGSQALVVHSGHQHSLTADGRLVGYSVRKEDARLATDEEIARYFSSLTDAHMTEFAKNDLLRVWLVKAGEKISEASLPKSSKKAASASPAPALSPAAA